MRKLFLFFSLSLVMSLVFASVAMAQYTTGPPGGPNDECSGAAEQLAGSEGYTLTLQALHYLPDVDGCTNPDTGAGTYGPLANFLNYHLVYDPDTGETLGLAKNLDPDLSSGANSITYQEFCRDFEISPYTPQEYFEQTANAKEQAILDPNGDGQACTAEDEAFLTGANGDNGANGDGAEQPGGDPEAVPELPDTGGPGLVLPIAGIAMIMGLGGLLLRRRLS